jgi:peptide chain release factor 1
MATIDDLITEIERSYDELTEQLADPEVLGDRARYTDAARAHAELQPVHELTQQYREAEQTVADAEGLLGDDTSDAEMREFAQDELMEGRRRVDELSEEIRVRMLTRDPNDGKDVIIEIRAGTGGNEACIFAGELARMYTRYAQAKGFEVEILSANENDDGGYKEVTLGVKGQGAFSMLKYEGGVHGHRGRAARGRGHRSRHPRGRSARRDLPRPRPRRAERQHHRLRRAHHARAHRRERQLPG